MAMNGVYKYLTYFAIKVLDISQSLACVGR